MNNLAVVYFGGHGPGKLPVKGKSPKVVRGGCKSSFGRREQRSPKSLLHHQKPFSVQEAYCALGPEDLHPLLTTFGDFPFSGNFPGPWLPKSNYFSNPIFHADFLLMWETKIVHSLIWVATVVFDGSRFLAGGKDQENREET